MTKALEYNQTLEYLIKNAEIHCNKYQTTIYWEDVYNYHYLLSAFKHKEEYLDWTIEIEVDGVNSCLHIFTHIMQSNKEGRRALIFIFNSKVINHLLSQNQKEIIQ